MHRGRWLLVPAIMLFVASAVCSQGDIRRPPGHTPQASQPAKLVPPPPAPTFKPQQQPAAPPSTPPAVVKKGSGPELSIKIKHQPGDTLYLTIEDEFRESGGVQPLLTFSSVIKERKYITQKVVPASTSPAPGPGFARMEWFCDRYEVRDKGMKEEAVFDSLQHLYPPPSLYLLGSIPESTCKFDCDAMGHATQIQTVPGKLSGQPGRGTPSKSVERCQLTPDNLKKLLDDLGPNYLPPEPVAVGAEWSHTNVEVQRNVGTVTTVVKSTLREIKEVDGTQIARIVTTGEYSLIPEKQQPPPAPTTRPGQPPAAAGKPREFKIERAVYSVDVDFDATRGELSQLTLRREFGVAAELEAQSLGPMTLKTSLAQSLKVTASHTPPPKPVIVGGKKPPIIPKEDGPAISGAFANMKPTSQPTSTQPVKPRPAPHNEKQPAGRNTFPPDSPGIQPPFGKPQPGRQPTLRPVTSRPAPTSRSSISK